MRVQPYLFFEGCCDEALQFYRKAIGAEVVMLMRMDEGPEPANPECVPPGCEKKVMHMQFRVGDTEIMASDGRCSGASAFQGFALTLNATSVAEAEKFFAALSEGGKVQMPLAKTFFAKSFGMVADKFGVMWMIMARE